ncbi:uncharacterized protein LOC102458707 [Pelodiscus sinensis]|uniref:uncharacterized protein LOC102458707 n=1 Tax=Pelodiscus sinensis TaxID=13735 RepID=UPI003F6AEDA8
MAGPVCLGSQGCSRRQKKLYGCLAGALVCTAAAVGVAVSCCGVRCQGGKGRPGAEDWLARLEEQRDGARAEAKQLRAELAGANETLGATRRRWEACGSLTDKLQSNLTALRNKVTQLEDRDLEREAKEQGLQEKIDKLRDELSSQSQQLQDSQQRFQEERDQLQETIRWLNVELRNQKNQRSNGGSLLGQRVSLYLVLLVLSFTGILLL